MAGIVVEAFSGQVLHALNAARCIEDQLRDAAVHVYTAEFQEVRVLVVFDRQFPAKYFSGIRILHFDRHRCRRDFK